MLLKSLLDLHILVTCIDVTSLIMIHVLHVRKMITGGEAAGDHLANMQDMIKDLEEKYTSTCRTKTINKSL